MIYIKLLRKSKKIMEPIMELKELYNSLNGKKDFKSLNKLKLINLYIKHIINIFNDSTENLNSIISSEIIELNKEIVILNETIEELRTNYWSLKQYHNKNT